MGMYMYKIAVDKKPKKVHYSKEYDLIDLELTISELKKYVSDNESFQINSDEGKIYVYGSRLETKEELKDRIAGEEAYNKRYDEYHASRKKR